MFMFDMDKHKHKNEEQFGIEFLQSSAFRSISPSSGYFVKELETMHGRPDVVVIGSDKYEFDSPVWRAASASPSTIIFSKILITMKASRKSMSVDDIVTATGVSYSACRLTVGSLVNENLARYLKNGNLKLNAEAHIPNTKIISIEFKLTDWRKALRQAARHRLFADSAYVIMPMNKRDLLKSKIEMFASFEISVLVYDDLSGDFELLHNAYNARKLSQLSYVDVLGRVFVNKDVLSPI